MQIYFFLFKSSRLLAKTIVKNVFFNRLRKIKQINKAFSSILLQQIIQFVRLYSSSSCQLCILEKSSAILSDL